MTRADAGHGPPVGAARCDPLFHPPDDADAGCITCGDVAIEMRVVRREPQGLALCEAEAGRETVDVTLVEPVGVGDRLLVHAGAALARLGGSGGVAA